MSSGMYKKSYTAIFIRSRVCPTLVLAVYISTGRVTPPFLSFPSFLLFSIQGRPTNYNDDVTRAHQLCRASISLFLFTFIATQT